MDEEGGRRFVFNDFLPLPFRILVLLQLGIHLWYWLVHLCYKVHKMNILGLLNLSYSPHKYSPDNHDSVNEPGVSATTFSADLAENQILLRGINATIKATLPVNIAGLLLYISVLILSDSDGILLKTTAKYVPLVLLVYTCYKFFAFHQSVGQTRMSSTIKRVLVGNINSKTMRTNDILISDSLTSYAKVINDFGSYLWVTLVSSLDPYNIYIEALVLSVPSLIRIKQCWYEFQLTKQKQHFYNMLKYCCLLGPVLINLLIKIKMIQLTDDAAASAQLNNLNKWWYISSAVSSTYSFIWDVRMDWGFGMFEPLFLGGQREFSALRQHNLLVYQNFFAYYGVIVTDLLLRFIWVFKIYVIKTTEVQLGLRHKVGNFLFGYDFLSFGFFVLELLEILRRWLWCFLKLESDLVKNEAKDEVAHAIPLATVKS